MSGIVQERYHPLAVGVNSSATITGNSVGGFLAYTSGTIAIVTNDATPRTIVTGLPVTAGVWTPIPFYMSHNGATVTTSGGASGVLGV